MSDPIISEAKLEAALNFLAESDSAYAQGKADLERADILRKRARLRCFLLASGNNEERKATADISGDVQQADETYCARLEAYEALKAKRERAEIVIDVWRSLEASRRRA